MSNDKKLEIFRLCHFSNIMEQLGFIKSDNNDCLIKSIYENSNITHNNNEICIDNIKTNIKKLIDFYKDCFLDENGNIQTQ